MQNYFLDLDKLKETRLSKNISIEEMSALMGFKGYQGYYYKERGLRKITAEELAKLSSILGVQIETFFLIK